jgi:ATPase subunit of ABC transporter with duplicated ATPase domains
MLSPAPLHELLEKWVKQVQLPLFGHRFYNIIQLYINAIVTRIIEIKDIEKSFGETKILKGISTIFETGKTNLIIGQSGSGKTVLLKSL